MGLDNYAGVRDKDEINLMPESLFNSNKLCSGICSGCQNSFRGKIYNDYVEYVTGQTLYCTVIPEQKVSEMADKLTKFVKTFIRDEENNAFEQTHAIYGVGLDEAEMLAEWFTVVAKNNGVVLGWW